MHCQVSYNFKLSSNESYKGCSQSISTRVLSAGFCYETQPFKILTTNVNIIKGTTILKRSLQNVCASDCFLYCRMKKENNTILPTDACMGGNNEGYYVPGRLQVLKCISTTAVFSCIYDEFAYEPMNNC